MKRIGLLSDTHSCHDDRYALHFAGCDEVWHAGDVGDAALLRHLESIAPVFRGVRGNIDHGDVARRLPEMQASLALGTACIHTQKIKMYF